MSTPIISAVQMNSQPNLSQNLKQVHHFIEEAAEKESQLVCLPENFAFLGDDEAMVDQAAEIVNEIEEKFPVWAQEFDIHILAGGYPVPAGPSKVYNRASLFRADGTIAAHYDKIHLFDVWLSKTEQYGESNYTKAGKPECVTADVPALGVMGLSICYDVRFPELYRKMADEGTNLITVPSAFTQKTGNDHWSILLRARAIENSAYVIAPAQTGTHGESRKTHGHSMIIDPWGKIIADGGIMPGIITAELDLDYLGEVRKQLPALKHRVDLD